MTNFLRAHPVTQGFRIDLLLCACAYFLFTLLWLRFIRNFLPVKPPGAKWLLAALALPVILIAGLELFCDISSYSSSILWLLSAVSATFIAIAPLFIYALFRVKTQTQAAQYV
jgi:hypothetical protein